MKSVIIPNKLYFRIGEVADLLSVKPYVLRYWETEFLDIKPAKSKSGQRLYEKKDLDHILRIKQLLYEEGYTISGAKKKMSGGQGGDVEDVIETAKKELREILEILK